MRRFGPLLMLATALHAGCAFTYQRPRPATAEQLQAQIAQDDTYGEPVTLLQPLPATPSPASTTRPQVDPTRALSIRPATETAPVAGVVASADPTALRGYEVKRRLTGAIEGLFWGLVGGAATGAAIGYMDGDDPPGFFTFSARDKATMAGVAGAVVGGVVGVVLGAVVGHTDRYLF